VLKQAGFEVIEASTGADALQKADVHPDLIVLDVNLPDVDGFEVCRRLKEAPATASIPVLYLSAAYRGPEHRVQGLELGADGYLTQPVDGRELVATVNALLRARQVRDAVADSEERFRSLMTAITGQ
jgi:DNA-binding response OmpR family regulator